MAKMHFLSLHVGPIIVLIPNLILRLTQSLKIENYIHFGLCRQPTNKSCLCGTQRAQLASFAIKKINNRSYMSSAPHPRQQNMTHQKTK